MDDDDVTKEQMTDFCNKARAAVGADRAVLVTSTHNHTNMCAAISDETDDNAMVMALLMCDLARAIVSINPKVAVSLQREEGGHILITAENSNIDVTQRVIEEML